MPVLAGHETELASSHDCELLAAIPLALGKSVARRAPQVLANLRGRTWMSKATSA